MLACLIKEMQRYRCVEDTHQQRNERIPRMENKKTKNSNSNAKSWSGKFTIGRLIHKNVRRSIKIDGSSTFFSFSNAFRMPLSTYIPLVPTVACEALDCIDCTVAVAIKFFTADCSAQSRKRIVRCSKVWITDTQLCISYYRIYRCHTDVNHLIRAFISDVQS